MPSSSRKVKLGLLQMSMSAEKEANLSKACDMIAEAAEQGAQIVCLPELFTSLYFPQLQNAKVRAEPIPGETTARLSKAAKSNQVYVVGGSLYERAGRNCYNTSMVFNSSGSMLGKYRKVHLPQDPSFFEQDYFKGGKEWRVFPSPWGKLGVLICFDQWYPEAARVLGLHGADFIFYPTAIGWVRGIEPVEGDWQQAWEAVQRGHAIANSSIVVAVNRVGKEGAMSFWGGSFAYDQFGTLLGRAGKEEEEVLVVECNPALKRDIEKGWGFLANRKPRLYSQITKK